MNKKLILFIIIITVFCTAVFADTPKVGLVLSGGGAKGIAHIGVLKVLEEHNIKPDFITGTSMGSIIGSLYSLGYTAEELEELVTSQDWDNMLLDIIPRSSISLEEKEDDGRYILTFPIENYNIKLPQGLVAGQNISQLLTRLMFSAHSITDFNELPIPFLCIATDIETGEAVVLDSGYLPEAVRTSMSIPSMFTPVIYDDKLLVDGGLVRNYPVSDCLEMGADFIIGVDVGAGLQKRDNLNSLVKIMEQAIAFQNSFSTQSQHNLTDILIQPQVDEFTITDFHKADSLITLGEKAARQVEDQIIELQNRLPQHKPAALDSHYPKWILIDKINISGLDKVSKNLVIGKIPLKEDAWTTIDEIDDAITKLYGSNYFERVVYKLIPKGDNKYNLNLEVTEKKTEVFRFGMHYDSDMKASVLLNTTFRNMLVQGSKLSIDIKLGDTRTFHWKEFVHTGWKPGIGLGLDLLYDKFSFDYRDSDGNKLARINIRNTASILDLRTIFSDQMAIGATLDYRQVQTTGDIVPQEMQNIDNKSNWLRAALYLRVDSRNQATYANSGTYLNFDVKQFYTNGDSVSTDPEFIRFFFQTQQLIPLHKRLTLSMGIFAGFTNTDDVPYEEAFYLGGFTDKDNARPFAGLNFAEVIAEEAYIARLKLQFEPFNDKYLIISLDSARVLRSFVGFEAENFQINGYAVSLGWLTPIGPIEYSIMGTDQNPDDFRTYISIGYNF